MLCERIFSASSRSSGTPVFNIKKLFLRRSRNARLEDSSRVEYSLFPIAAMVVSATMQSSTPSVTRSTW